LVGVEGTSSLRKVGEIPPSLGVALFSGLRGLVAELIPSLCSRRRGGRGGVVVRGAGDLFDIMSLGMPSGRFPPGVSVDDPLFALRPIGLVSSSEHDCNGLPSETMCPLSSNNVSISIDIQISRKKRFATDIH
jgi:hypothetical protein